MKPGDVVQLKSGGPALTVIAEEGDKVRCLFYADEVGEFREMSLPIFALDQLEEEDEEDDNEEDESEDDADMEEGEDDQRMR